ncbi:hypothetical protein ACFWUW_05995 [Streptomyces sp. NPDC058655]|uniref:hypothetical protein n=1 Tax=unclassified Streptomyces TaxID=2593676 RepID=UPI00364B31FE
MDVPVLGSLVEAARFPPQAGLRGERDSALTERQIPVHAGILVLGQAQGHFVLQAPPRLLAASFVAMEDGYQMEVLAGRRTRGEVIAALWAYARAVTGRELAEHS